MTKYMDFSGLKIKYLITALFLLAVAFFVGLGIFQEYQKHQDISNLDDNLKLQTPPGSIILAREYVADGSIRPIDLALSADQSASGPDSIVSYTYVSNVPAPAETYDNLKEDIDKRSPTSQQFVVYKNDKEEKYVGKFYASTNFAKESGRWYKTETATTTKSAFLKQTRQTLLAKAAEFFGRKALADVFYSGAGDGHVYKDDSVDWTITHDATTSTGASYSAQSAVVRSWQEIKAPGTFYLYRLFLPFDTSAIPSNATIISADLNIFVLGTTHLIDDGNDVIYTVETFQADSTALVTGDYEDCGSDNGTAGRARYVPVPGDDVGYDITNILTSAYLDIPLNASGLSWIKKSGETSSCGTVAGYTCLGIREGHDIINLEINGSQDNGNSVTIATSETEGTVEDPYLTVIYTTPGPAFKLNSGQLRLNSGRIIVNSN
jgi:hypothetical protein